MSIIHVNEEKRMGSSMLRVVKDWILLVFAVSNIIYCIILQMLLSEDLKTFCQHKLNLVNNN